MAASREERTEIVFMEDKPEIGGAQDRLLRFSDFHSSVGVLLRQYRRQEWHGNCDSKNNHRTGSLRQLAGGWPEFRLISPVSLVGYSIAFARLSSRRPQRRLSETTRSDRQRVRRRPGHNVIDWHRPFLRRHWFEHQLYRRVGTLAGPMRSTNAR